MASTSTNKQPLLIDRVFHEVFSMKTKRIMTDDVSGTNSAVAVINCTSNDGALIEDIYAISMNYDGSEAGVSGANATPYVINLYLAADGTSLPESAVFVGRIEASTTKFNWVHAGEQASGMLPFVHAPVPQEGGNAQLKGFYVPKGKALWAARRSETLNDTADDAPILGVTGGYF